MATSRGPYREKLPGPPCKWCHRQGHDVPGMGIVCAYCEAEIRLVLDELLHEILNDTQLVGEP